MKVPIIVAVLCCFLACSKPAPVPTPSSGYVEVIKLKQPEYKQHIMVYVPEKEDVPLSVSVSNSYFCTSQEIETICGQSPYIELPQNYLLIDWKWRRIFSYLVNEEGLIADEWITFDDINQTWPKEQLYVNRPIQEYYVVEVSRLKEYNGGYLRYPYLNPELCYQEFSEEKWERMSKEEKENMVVETLRMDSSYMEYKEILDRMIGEGVFLDYATNGIK